MTKSELELFMLNQLIMLDLKNKIEHLLPLEIEHSSRRYPLKDPYVLVAQHTAHPNETFYGLGLHHISEGLTIFCQRFLRKGVTNVCVLYDTRNV